MKKTCLVAAVGYALFFTSCTNIGTAGRLDEETLSKAEQTYPALQLDLTTTNELAATASFARSLEYGTNVLDQPQYRNVEEKYMVINKEAMSSLLETDVRLDKTTCAFPTKIETSFETGTRDKVTGAFLGSTQTDVIIKAGYLGEVHGNRPWIGLEKSIDDGIVYVGRFMLENDSTLIWVSGRQVVDSRDGNFFLLSMDPRSGMIKFFSRYYYHSDEVVKKNFIVSSFGTIENVDEYAFFVKQKENLVACLASDMEDIMHMYQ